MRFLTRISVGLVGGLLVGSVLAVMWCVLTGKELTSLIFFLCWLIAAVPLGLLGTWPGVAGITFAALAIEAFLFPVVGLLGMGVMGREPPAAAWPSILVTTRETLTGLFGYFGPILGLLFLGVAYLIFRVSKVDLPQAFTVSKADLHQDSGASKARLQERLDATG